MNENTRLFYRGTRTLAHQKRNQERESTRARGRWPPSLAMVLMLGVVVVAGCAQAQPNRDSGSSGRRAAGGAHQLSEGESGSAQAAGWLSFGDNPTPSPATFTGQGYSSQEVSAATVSQLKRAWAVKLPELADERPILVRNVKMSDGTHDVLYLTTDHGTLLAIDAATGTQLWATTPKSDNRKYTKATPVADPANNLVYSYGLDGKVHRFRLTTGQEVLGDGWPVTVTLMKQSEKVSSALNLANGYLYVTTASFSGDAPPYQGHMVAINVQTGATHVFNSICNDHEHLLAPGECKQSGGGIWGRPAVTVDPITGNIFFTTSDAYFDIDKGGHSWGDSVIEMTADGSRVVDSYTPENYAIEAFQNRDLGSTSPVLLPQLANSRTPYLAVQAGKEGLLRLLNRQDLSGQGGPAHVGGELQTVELQDLCPALAQPLSWQDPAGGGVWLFVTTLCHIDAFRVVTSTQGKTSLQLAWKVEVNATSPILVNGVLFVAISRELVALDPHTGRQLWSSAQTSARGSIDRIHWESPIIVDNRLYCTDESGTLSMYQL